MMLNPSSSFTMEYLLSQPTVLEFAAIGNDEDKAFILGALLLHLTEYRSMSGLTANRLRHVTVVEEAHRLLTAVPQHQASEEANTRGKAVETFCNMLAEIRAYGEGIVIVDQIPTKLAPEILKNTNLKIAHRLVAEDERRKVGGCMNMSEKQMGHLATLRSGQAIVYAEGCESAFLLQIPNHCRQNRNHSQYINMETLMKHMQDKMPVFVGCNSDYKQANVSNACDLGQSHCPGCQQAACPTWAETANYLLEHDHADAFAQAVEIGWDGLWSFGQRIARSLWPDKDKSSQAPYCILMTIAGLAGYEESVCEKLRENLMLLRQHHSGSEE